MPSKKKAKQSTAVPKFSAERAVQLYNGGKLNVSQVAQAMGFPQGTGNNRTREALLAAGVYRLKNAGKGRARSTTGKKAPVSRARAVPNLGMGVPDDPETTLKVCLRTIDVNAAKLKMDGPTQSRFARTLMGMIATNFGVTDFQVRKPLLVMDVDRAQHVLQVANA